MLQGCLPYPATWLYSLGCISTDNETVQFYVFCVQKVKHSLGSFRNVDGAINILSLVHAVCMQPYT